MLNYKLLNNKTIRGDFTINSCFFIGHREANERVLPRLESVIDRLITKEDVRYFYVGGYGGFDQIVATAVKRAKKKYPDITLMLVLPYHPAERPIEKPPGYDGTYYPEGLEKTPRPFAIAKANQLMVNSCEWMVCYVRHGASNSRNLLEYAQRRERKGLIQITNIAEGMGANL
ncbi:MAG: hypothetical protein IJF02_01485 [Oscillospiraceae bacterium]|nr:hypothetical protein [Oscillospiraceae bacterium]